MRIKWILFFFSLSNVQMGFYITLKNILNQFKHSYMLKVTSCYFFRFFFEFLLLNIDFRRIFLIIYGLEPCDSIFIYNSRISNVNK